jgi:hypothetical protein
MRINQHLNAFNTVSGAVAAATGEQGGDGWHDPVAYPAYGVVGNGVADDRTALSSLATAVAALGAGLRITKEHVIGTSWTPACPLHIAKGGRLKISAGATLTLSQPFSAGIYQAFDTSGGGTVVFSAGSIEKALPEWWGIDGTDDHLEWQMAWDSVRAAGLRVTAGSKTYTFALRTVSYTASTISFDNATALLADSANGLTPFRYAVAITVSGSASNNGLKRTLPLSPAPAAGSIGLDTAPTTEVAGAAITLTAYLPAFMGWGGSNREIQPRVENGARVTVSVAFPADAPRELPVIHFVRGDASSNPRAYGWEGLRLNNTTAPVANAAGTDYRGVGVKVSSGWTGSVLRNAEIMGFHRGVVLENGYILNVADSEARNCNFGFCLWGFNTGVPNACLLQNLMTQEIYPIASDPDGFYLTGGVTLSWPVDATATVGYRIGAGYVVGNGGTVSGICLASCGVEASRACGIYVGSNAQAATILSPRLESCYFPIYLNGPLSPNYANAIVITSPTVDCDQLRGAAFIFKRVKGVSILNPLTYQRGNLTGGWTSQAVAEFTSAATECKVELPTDNSSSATLAFKDAFTDAGQNNHVVFGDASLMSDGNVVALGMVVKNAAAAGTTTTAHMSGDSSHTSFPMLGPGSILGYAVQFITAPAGDSVTINVLKSGVSVAGASLIIAAGTAAAQIRFKKGQFTFAAGDRIAFEVVTGAALGAAVSLRILPTVEY